ncbi:hypothetical protein THOM_2215 [Trachipleistophora hominis]|uniref:Uncharacterized protein n=1 Tax=Trachipleistophora hominis TaxID=72359 RepID=L7JTV6_TRAHO|nr:hypothetical protein THOM_2215 [Trachipleistophora hominis]
MFLFIDVLRCYKYLYPLAKKFNEYVAMDTDGSLSLFSFKDLAPSYNPNAPYEYFPDQHSLLIGRSIVGDGTFRSPVYKGNGDWEVIYVKPEHIMLKNGTWCLSVRNELLMVKERALILSGCTGDSSQVFYVHDDRYLPRPSHRKIAQVLGAAF